MRKELTGHFRVLSTVQRNVLEADEEQGAVWASGRGDMKKPGVK